MQRKGMLPRAGGWLDQPAKVMRAIEAVQSAEEPYRAARALPAEM